MDNFAKRLSTDHLCRIASIYLYSLATRSTNEDTAGRALFFLSELEHYDTANPPTAIRRAAIERFVLSCHNFRKRLEALTRSIPELSELC